MTLSPYLADHLFTILVETCSVPDNPRERDRFTFYFANERLQPYAQDLPIGAHLLYQWSFPGLPIIVRHDDRVNSTSRIPYVEGAGTGVQLANGRIIAEIVPQRRRRGVRT